MMAAEMGKSAIYTLEKAIFARRLVIVCLFAVAFPLSGCVSTTLDSNQFQSAGDAGSADLTEGNSIAVTGEPLDLSAGAVERRGVQTPGETPVSEPEVVLDPAARQAAVEEMRAKAENRSGVKQQIGGIPEAATDRLNSASQQELESELRQAADEADNAATDAELAAKKREIDAMRRKANSHFDDALRKIEN